MKAIERFAEIYGRDAEGCGTDAPGSFIASLCTRTRVHAWPMPGERLDIGNLESYEEAKNHLSFRA